MLFGFFLPVLVLAFVVAMCGVFYADVRSDFALLPLYRVRLVTDTPTILCFAPLSIVTALR